MRRSIRAKSMPARSAISTPANSPSNCISARFLPEIDPKLRGIPTMHTEAACASGALSVLLASQWVMGGFYDVVLVVGAEQQKTMSSLDGSDVLGAAADYHVEKPEYGDFMFPKLFGKIAQIYIDKYGVSPNALAQVASKNYAHAKLNPLAQMRDAEVTYESASQVSEKNPAVAPPLKVSDCSQITDGAASLVLCSERYLKKIGRDKSKSARLLGFGHTTDYLAAGEEGCADILDRAQSRDERLLDGKPETARHAWRGGARLFFDHGDLAYEILGLAEPGKGAELAMSGATALPQVRGEHVSGKIDFEIPVNAGGGLIGDGHPVGATGVRQVFEAYQQLTDQAGARQIKGAKKFLTFNMGGSLTTSVAMIWGRD